MSAKKSAQIMLALAALMTLTACANTIRGMGQDTANTVNATQSAGRHVDRAAKY